jgi:putative RNA 2'-phosphotransferase
MQNKSTEVSKFLSFVLRHSPDAIGITLDREGWADIAALITGAAATGKILSVAQITDIVATNAKKRFEISPDGLKIRAVQGHSADSVDIDYPVAVPPDTLFHGTAERFLSSIMAQGLLAGERHHVHLSSDNATAISVGSRHGAPCVLLVNTGQMVLDGHKFYQAKNGVWLTLTVPQQYLILSR